MTQYDAKEMQLKYRNSIIQSTNHSSGTMNHASSLVILCLDSCCLLLRNAQDYEPAGASDRVDGPHDEILQDKSF